MSGRFPMKKSVRIGMAARHGSCFGRNMCGEIDRRFGFGIYFTMVKKSRVGEYAMKYHVNENIKNTIRVFPEQGRYDKHRYDMNENPKGLPKDFVDSVLKEVTPEFLSVYPESNRFINKYAKYVSDTYHVSAGYDNILTTNGSDMAIRYILETFGEPGKDVVTVSPSFEMYWVNCNILGYHHVPVSYKKDLTVDIENILAVINENTRIVVLLNPNNPVGNVYTEEEVQKVIDKSKSVGAVVVIDEAYHYFYDKTFIRHALIDENVIVMRTFSKLMSLAACRLGVIIGNPEIIHYIKNARLTFDVNSFALLFAERLLDNPELIEQLIQIEKEGKKYTLDILKENGYWFKDCMGNFILVEPKTDAHRLSAKLKREKILVHPYGNELLNRYIRVSVGDKESMKKFLGAFLKLDHIR